MDDTRRPLPRRTRPVLIEPSNEDLEHLSLHRVQDAVSQDISDPPPRIYPTVEHTRATFFTQVEWDQFGNLETERGRLTYTLTKYADRGIPRQCQNVIQSLLSRESVLDAWDEIVPSIREAMGSAVQNMITATRTGLPTSNQLATKASFLALPVPFETVPGSVEVWSRALDEIAEDIRDVQTGRLSAFIQLHAFVKDPASDFEVRSAEKTTIAEKLLVSFKSATSSQNHEPTLGDERLRWQSVAAQLAAEASFLDVATTPPFRVNHVLFSHHQQLCYFDCPLDSLERAEFSLPSRVVALTQEMLLSTATQTKNECHIVPIVAGPCPGQLNPINTAIIIDGNNRTTAIMLLRFLATSYGHPDPTSRLQAYCDEHHLGIKWQIDLSEALEAALSDTDLQKLLNDHNTALQQFADVTKVPALLAQEDNFHTICLQRTKLQQKNVLLLPVHQALYNHRDLGLALPQRAAQAHGMTLGTAVLPLR